jgi:hypothetical protein
MAEEANAPTRFPARVVEVIDSHRIVINRGSADGVKGGQRFLVYMVGKELFDPETHKSLGRLEIVRGTGAVTHVQDRLATLTSDKRSKQRRTIRRHGVYAVYLGAAEETEETEEAEPFDKPSIGDVVKPL